MTVEDVGAVATEDEVHEAVRASRERAADLLERRVCGAVDGDLV